jgi:hypothetical protein
MMKLPGDSGGSFEELQVFNQVWIWAFMGAETLLVLLPMLVLKVAFPAYSACGPGDVVDYGPDQFNKISNPDR